MLSTIKWSQLLQRTKLFSIIAGLFIVSIITASCATDNGKEASNEYDTEYEALKAYYLNERSMEITESELSEITLNSFSIDENQYYLMKEYTKGDKGCPYVYVLVAGREGDKWRYGQATADYMLVSPDNSDSPNQGPDAEFEISIEDKRIFVGMLSSSEDTPVVKGESFTIDEDDGIYSYIYTVDEKQQKSQ